MSFKFIKEIDNTIEETATVAGNLDALFEGETETINILAESATAILAKAKEALSQGKELPDDAPQMLAAFSMLQDPDQRDAIASTLKNGIASIRKVLKNAGPNDKANSILVKWVDAHGQQAKKAMMDAAEKAATDENARKRLIQHIGKMMDTMGRIQSATEKPAAPAEKQEKTVASWFK